MPGNPGGGGSGPDDTCPLPEAGGGPTTVSYTDDVVPVLARSGCFSGGCHGGLIHSSGYDLRSYASSFVAGDEAEALGLCPIVPGDPDRSYLMEKIQPNPRSGQQMPLLRPELSEADVELIATWIREGAQDN